MDRVAVEQDKNHPTTITMVSYKQAEQKFMDKVGKMSDKDKYGHNSLCLFFQRSRTTILASCLSFAVVLTLIFVIGSYFANQTIGPPEVIFRGPNGSEATIRGRRLMLGEGDYFLSIPYSKITPRFHAATVNKLLPEKQSTFFSADEYTFGCPNGFVRTKAEPIFPWTTPPSLETVIASEQCQTLNIYRCSPPKRPFYMMLSDAKEPLLPVLVYVNEGNWIKRSNANLEPISTIRDVACNSISDTSQSINENVIVVSINFRMGFYGFFNSPISASSDIFEKNPALTDVRAALEWVSKHIDGFGGDPDRVTVMGRGVGAQLVSMLSHIPETQNLFKRLVLISGSAYTPSLYQTSRFTLAEHDDSYQIALGASCANANEWQLLKGEIPQQSLAIGQKVQKCAEELAVEKVPLIEGNIINGVPAFIRWPILMAKNQVSSVVNTSTPAKESPMPPYAFPAPHHPAILGLCNIDRQTLKQEARAGEPPPAPIKFSNLEEFRVRLLQFADFRRLNYSDEVVAHYVRTLNETNELMRSDDSRELLDAVRNEFVMKGPLFLEAIKRSQQGNARVYWFEYNAPSAMLLRKVDEAEYGAERINKWAGDQLACIDDLIFNSLSEAKTDEIPQTVIEQQTRLKKYFIERLTSFISIGEPNFDSQTTNNNQKTLEWPTFLPRRRSTAVHENNKNKGLVLVNAKALYLEANGHIGVGNFSAHSTKTGDEDAPLLPFSTDFWTCQMAKFMGLQRIFC